jgi:hypothetical protein
MVKDLLCETISVIPLPLPTMRDQYCQSSNVDVFHRIAVSVLVTAFAF